VSISLEEQLEIVTQELEDATNKTRELISEEYNLLGRREQITRLMFNDDLRGEDLTVIQAMRRRREEQLRAIMVDLEGRVEEIREEIDPGEERIQIELLRSRGILSTEDMNSSSSENIMSHRRVPNDRIGPNRLNRSVDEIIIDLIPL